jgi:integrase
MVDRRLGEGLSGSTIRNAVIPLQVVYRHAIRRDLVSVSPAADLDLPKARSGKKRIASPAEATALIDALPSSERALWATAFYAGLRRGELRGLRWSGVDLGRSEIRVECSWDECEGPTDPKTATSSRTVPIFAALRDHLDAHLIVGGRGDSDLVFGRTSTDAFVASTVGNRAKRAWEAAKLEPITFHECRHTFASLLIDAGTNAKAISTFMGHSSIEITFNTYGHLMPGNREQTRERVDRYLDAAQVTKPTAAPQSRHSPATV